MTRTTANDFKQAVRRLLARGEYPLPVLIDQELGRQHKRKSNGLNGRESRWRREVCQEMHFELTTFRTLVPTELPAAAKSAEVYALTDGQRRAFYAKTGAIERAQQAERGSVRARSLAAASEAFGRQIESVNDLTSIEASWVLDKLTAEVDELVHEGLLRV